MLKYNSVALSSDVYRNIPSIRVSQSLFDDLIDDVESMPIIALEASSRPSHVNRSPRIICRPFDDADWLSVVAYPFENVGASRLSDGSYGVWYASLALETTIYETLHYLRELIDSAVNAGKIPKKVERRVYVLHVNRILIDVTSPATTSAQFSNPSNHAYAQKKAAELRDSGAQGIRYASARHTGGINIGMFTDEGISNPRDYCYLEYVFSGRDIVASRNGSEVLRIKDFV